MLSSWEPEAIAVAAFLLFGIYGLASHYVLYFILWKRKAPTNRYLQTLPFYPPLLYWRNRETIRSLALDLLAISATASMIAFLLVASLCAPLLWG